MGTQLEIIVYGLACFDPLDRGAGYRVLFPDGRNPAPYRVPPHFTALWIRERASTAIARWPWLAKDNDFMLGDKRILTFTGVKKTDLDVSNFTDRLANLCDSDSTFKIAANPEFILETTIDRGTLSAHEMAGGMIVVKWVVQKEDETKPVVFHFGREFVEVPPDAVQVVLANAGQDEDDYRGRDSHFMLYRKLAEAKLGPLAPKRPRKAPQARGVTLIKPSHDYLRPRTPRRDCSGVFAR